MRTKRTLKGMTLLECIIAVAALAALSLILIRLGVTVDKTTRATTNLKTKVAEQTPYAASGRTDYGFQTATDASGVWQVVTDAVGDPVVADFQNSTIAIAVEMVERNADGSVKNTLSGSYNKLKDPNDPSKGFEDTATRYGQTVGGKLDTHTDLTGTVYDTISIYTDKMSAEEIAAYLDNPNGGLNMEFIKDIEVVTEPTT